MINMSNTSETKKNKKAENRVNLTVVGLFIK